jgi:hypothetical protein
MGQCECMVRSHQSVRGDQQPPSPMPSRQEDLRSQEDADEEGMAINQLRSFKCQSLASVKQHQLAHQRRLSTFLLKPPDETEVTGISLTPKEILRLKSMKIDPTIFINKKKGKVSENYNFEQVLGEGTYGKVVLVTHKKTQLKRALKSKFGLTSHKARIQSEK